MGPEHIQAARLYAGINLFFETLPYSTEMTTDDASGDITDSAAAATTMATGVKVNNRVVSLTIPGTNTELETLLEYFQKQGTATGLIATSYITDNTHIHSTLINATLPPDH